MKRIGILLVLTVMTIFAYFSLLKPGIHNIQDDMQFFRVFEMSKCFADNQFPCRWVPDLGYGYGYPLFIYYSPGPYYLGFLFHQLGSSYIDSVKMLFILGFIGSALGMYYLLKELFGSELSAIIGSFLYIYVPVRAVQVYVRGSLGEFLAMTFFPWIFLFSFQLARRYTRRIAVFLSLMIAGLLITHNLMCLIFFPVWITWLICLRLENKSAFSFSRLVVPLLPLSLLKGEVHLESMVGGYFDYRQHFVTLYQLFISNHWGYGSSVLGPIDDLSLSIGQVLWVLAALGFVVALFRKSRNYVLVAIMALFLTFLMHQKSSFIWERLPMMAFFQFPWRMLPVVVFLLTLLATLFINSVSGIKKYFICSLTLFLVICLYRNFFVPQKWLSISDNDLISGEGFVKQQTASIFDYLPIGALKPPNIAAPSEPIFIDGKVVVDGYIMGSNFQRGSFTVASTQAKVRVPLYDFPGMTVVDNGKVIDHDHHDCRNQPYCFGLIDFSLDNGHHEVQIYYKRTMIEILADGTSLMALVGLIIVSFYKYKHEN